MVICLILVVNIILLHAILSSLVIRWNTISVGRKSGTTIMLLHPIAFLNIFLVNLALGLGHTFSDLAVKIAVLIFLVVPDPRCIIEPMHCVAFYQLQFFF